MKPNRQILAIQNKIKKGCKNKEKAKLKIREIELNINKSKWLAQ